MTAHKPARVDTLRHFAKCACGERFKGSDYSDKLSRHLGETAHVGSVNWSYGADSLNYEMSQNELDDALSTFAGMHDEKGNPDVDWDSDATGFKAESGESTPRGRLRLICSELNKSAEEVMVTKNEDYAEESDPFANFRMFGGLGILVRLSDKLARLRQFEERGEFSVTDETLRDSCIDGINYFKLYYAYKTQEKA